MKLITAISCLILIINGFILSKFGLNFIFILFNLFALIWLLTATFHMNRNKSTSHKFLSNIFHFTTIFTMALFIFCEVSVYQTGINGYNLSNANKSNIDTIIILGAGLWQGDQLSPALRSRMDVGLKFLIEYPNTNVILSGGQGSDESVSEAQAMGQYLLDNNISSNRIIYESKSTSTLENLLYSKDILLKDSNILPHIGIVSNDFHLFRAKMIASRLNFENAEVLSSPTPESTKFKSHIREFPSIIIDFFRSLFV